MSETAFSLVTPEQKTQVMLEVSANFEAAEHLCFRPCHSITFRNGDGDVFYVVANHEAMPWTLADEGMAFLVKLSDPETLSELTYPVDCGAGVGIDVSKFLLMQEPMPIDFLETIAKNLSDMIGPVIGGSSPFGRGAPRSRPLGIPGFGNPFGSGRTGLSGLIGALLRGPSPFGSLDDSQERFPGLRQSIRDMLDGGDGMLAIEIDMTGDEPKLNSQFIPFDQPSTGAEEETGSDDASHDASTFGGGGGDSYNEE